jgi:uncharacterized iron-regulated membrane protein
MIKNKSLFIRRVHRYLGLFIGVQFLGWTISGLYFSWNNIDNVHGDHMRKSPHFLKASDSVIAPTKAISELKSESKIDSLHSIQLISLLGKPLYQIVYFSGHAGDLHHQHTHYALADATTGMLRGPLTKEESIALAKDYVISSAEVKEVNLLEAIDAHHEYRERPLPAYAISFKNPDCTVYISTERGSFQTIRHDQWRAFDFLWMFHTMDYAGRDNFNNWLLRILSVFGLLTVVSGFVLYTNSSRTIRRMFNIR